MVQVICIVLLSICFIVSSIADTARMDIMQDQIDDLYEIVDVDIENDKGVS